MIEGVSPRVGRIIEQVVAKRTMLRAYGGELRTLVVGSSYGEHGFDPAHYPGAFNLCFRLQDLKHSCALYETIAPSCPALQTVVVFHAIGSGSNFAEHIPEENLICAVVNEAFGLGIRYRVAAVRALLGRLEGRLTDLSADLGGRRGFMPHLLDGRDRGDVPDAIRAGQHVVLSKRHDGDLSLLRLLLLARSRGHRVVVVTPPARSGYVEAVGTASRRIFRDLSRLLFRDPHGCPVQWVNCFDSGEFDDSDFLDCDHLKPGGPGTRRLSVRIRDAAG